MENIYFILHSIILGVALAMDAFSVSIADAIKESSMRKTRMCLIALTYGFFQFIMPLLGYFAVHTIVELFSAFQVCIPWIALALLSYLGIKSIKEGASSCEDENTEVEKLSHKGLLLQGIATSIDALSVGFTISNYSIISAFSASLLIALTTFIICMFGLLIGKKAGEKLGNKAEIFGGLILIAIGLEIFIKAAINWF